MSPARQAEPSVRIAAANVTLDSSPHKKHATISSSLLTPSTRICTGCQYQPPARLKPAFMCRRISRRTNPANQLCADLGAAL
jgi:hypothetical protein